MARATDLVVDLAGREDAATDGWERVWGTASGVASPADGVVGLDADHGWTAEFEVIGPVDGGAHDAVLVDTENRGGRSTHDMLAPEIAAGRVAYARIQWQVDHADGVPEHAQGVGLVILRDFGRWLRDRFRVLVLAGASQSAWCVNTFVAEGFNVDPDSGARRLRRRLRLPLGRELAGDQPVGRRRRAAGPVRASPTACRCRPPSC